MNVGHPRRTVAECDHPDRLPYGERGHARWQERSGMTRTMRLKDAAPLLGGRYAMSAPLRSGKPLSAAVRAETDRAGHQTDGPLYNLPHPMWLTFPRQICNHAEKFANKSLFGLSRRP